MAEKEPTYPKELLIQRQEDGDETYFVAYENPEDVACVGESIEVAVYVRHRFATVTAPVQVT